MTPIVLVLAATLAQGAQQMQQPHATRAINHYDLDVPSGYTIKDVSPARSDFDLYEVGSSHSGAKLSLYFGNHPDFPRFKWPAPPRTDSHDGRTVKEYPYAAGPKRLEGLLKFEGLTYKTTGSTPYAYVHYFANDVSEADARAFQQIIRSIRVGRPHLE